MKRSKVQTKYLETQTGKLNRYQKEVLVAIDEIEKLIKTKKEVVIAIDGMSGSGKTTLAFHFKKIFNANLFHIDDFFKKPNINNDDPLLEYGANIDFSLILKSIINKIENNEDVFYNPFDFKSHRHLEEITVKARSVNIIEGSFSMHPYLIDNYDYKIFLKTNKCKQLRRIYKRSGFKKFRMFVKRWIPNENRYRRDLKIDTMADIIIKS